jgi:hypothetical protein
VTDTSYTLNATDSNGNAVILTLSAAIVPPPVVAPVGVPGNWANPAFQDTFPGTALDKTRWAALNGNEINGTSCLANPANVSVNNGLVMTLASATSGAFISSAPSDGAGANGWLLPVGGCAEASVYLPGSSTTDGYNWSGWWASGPNWPAGGEEDICEILSGNLTCNYHATSGSQNGPAPAGAWFNAYHTFSVLREATQSTYYWDGKEVWSLATDDNGAAQSLLLSVGNGGNAMFGAAGAMKVAYVRGWNPPTS